METGIVEKISEYVPLFDHKILEQKYEKLQQEHESLMKTVEVLKSTLGFTLDLVNKQEHELLPNEIIQDWENNISEMQKRIWRNQGTESCQPLEEPGATNPSLSAREDSLPEVHMKGSKKKREKKREKKKKEDSLCDEKMVDDADQIPPQDPAHMSCSQEENRNPKRDRNSLEEINIANVTVEQGVIRDVNAKTQSPRAKRKKKKRKTKALDVNKPVHVVNDAENGSSEEGTSVATVVVDMKSKEDKEELREDTDVKLSEDVVQTLDPKAKRRKKKKTKAMEVCDPLGSVQLVETAKKEKEDQLGSVQAVETTEKEKEYPLESVQAVETAKKKKEDPLGTVLVVESTEKEKEDKTGELMHGGFEEDVKTKESEMKEIPLDYVLQRVSPAEETFLYAHVKVVKN